MLILYALLSTLFLNVVYAERKSVFVIDDFSLGQGSALISTGSAIQQSYDFPSCPIDSLVGCSRDLKVQPISSLSGRHVSSITSDSSFPGAWSIISPDNGIVVNYIEYDGLGNFFENSKESDGIDLSAGSFDPALQFHFQSNMNAGLDFIFKDMEGNECALTIQLEPSTNDQVVVLPFSNALPRNCDLSNIDYIHISHVSSAIGSINIKKIEIVGTPAILAPLAQAVWSLFEAGCIQWDSSVFEEDELISLNLLYGENMQENRLIAENIAASDSMFQWEKIYGATPGLVQVKLTTRNQEIVSEPFSLSQQEAAFAVFCDAPLLQ